MRTVTNYIVFLKAIYNNLLKKELRNEIVTELENLSYFNSHHPLHQPLVPFGGQPGRSMSVRW